MNNERQLPSRLRRFVTFGTLVVISLFVFAGCCPGPTGEQVGEKEAAEIIISTVVEKVWEQADKSEGLRVNQYKELLSRGTRVQPALVLPGEEPLEMVCQNQCWLFLIDEAPDAHFAHPVQILLLDAETRDQQIIQTDWWPQIDGKPIFDKVADRTDPVTIIFYEPPLLGYEIPEREELPEIHGPHELDIACETWAVIVCGYNDLPDTFDEDTDGIYNVLIALDIPDDHIFFVSPHTTHAGVDRATSITNVQWAINQVVDTADATDKVLFFYSSHGNIDILACIPDDPGGGYITAASLDSWLDAITYDELVIIIEACHSGSLIGRYASGAYVAAEDDLTGDGETNRAIFTSASTDTSSYPDKDGTDDPNPGDIGSETIWGYVEAFSAAPADTNGDDEISFGEAWQYAWDNDVTQIRGWNTPQMVHTGLVPNEVFNYCPCPDLVVETLTHSPDTPTTVDEITFTAVVKNIGAGTASSSTLSFRVGGETTPQMFSVPSLVPGQTYTAQRQLVLGVAQNYIVTAIADVNNDVPESNEINNQRTDTFTVI